MKTQSNQGVQIMIEYKIKTAKGIYKLSPVMHVCPNQEKYVIPGVLEVFRLKNGKFEYINSIFYDSVFSENYIPGLDDLTKQILNNEKHNHAYHSAEESAQARIISNKLAGEYLAANKNNDWC